MVGLSGREMLFRFVNDVGGGGRDRLGTGWGRARKVGPEGGRGNETEGERESGQSMGT